MTDDERNLRDELSEAFENEKHRKRSISGSSCELASNQPIRPQSGWDSDGSRDLTIDEGNSPNVFNII